MELGGRRILLLVNDDGRLLGVVTDSDIRRWVGGKWQHAGSRLKMQPN